MFLLITPAHNEVDQVDDLLNCMRASTLQPDHWLIVDDYSNDGTGERFLKSGFDLKFLRVYRIEQSATYMEFHYSEVLQKGFRIIDNLLKQADFIGILDADIRFGPNYWKRLAKALTINPYLGIVSGILCSRNKLGKLSIEPYQRIDNPRGGLRLIKRDCFHDIGGVQRSRAPDSIMNVKARLQGWKIAILPNVYVKSTRPTHQRNNAIIGSISEGLRAWHLHQPIWQVLIRTCAKLMRGNFSSALNYMSGYIKEWWNKGEQFPDKDIRHYYRVERTLEWIRSVWFHIEGGKDPSKIISVKGIAENEIFFR